MNGHSERMDNELYKNLVYVPDNTWNAKAEDTSLHSCIGSKDNNISKVLCSLFIFIFLFVCLLFGGFFLVLDLME